MHVTSSETQLVFVVILRAGRPSKMADAEAVSAKEAAVEEPHDQTPLMLAVTSHSYYC